jgi:hypothetical protein
MEPVATHLERGPQALRSRELAETALRILDRTLIELLPDPRTKSGRKRPR